MVGAVFWSQCTNHWPFGSSTNDGKSAQFTKNESPWTTVRGSLHRPPVSRTASLSADPRPASGSCQVRTTRPSAEAWRLCALLPAGALNSTLPATYWSPAPAHPAAVIAARAVTGSPRNAIRFISMDGGVGGLVKVPQLGGTRKPARLRKCAAGVTPEGPERRTAGSADHAWRP